MPRNQNSNRFALSTLPKVIACLALLALIVAGVLAVATVQSTAAPVTPIAANTLTVGGPAVTWSAGPFFVANATDQADGVPTCNAVLPCSDFTLNVDVPAGYERCPA